MSERDTIPATCPRCGRPISTSWYCGVDKCWPGEASCDVIAAAYARGIDAGVRLAKERATTRLKVKWPEGEWTEIDWTDVDKAAAAAKGERDDER